MAESEGIIFDPLKPRYSNVFALPRVPSSPSAPY